MDRFGATSQPAGWRRRSAGSLRTGEVFPCVLSASTLRDSHGEVIGYMGISRDITVLKRAQTELLAAHDELKEKNEQLAELNASKDKFFSIIAHDLRGSFGTLLGFAQLVNENIDLIWFTGSTNN